MLSIFIAACVPPPTVPRSAPPVIEVEQPAKPPIVEPPQVAEPPADIEPEPEPEPAPEIDEPAIAHGLDREPEITITDEPPTPAELVAEPTDAPAADALADAPTADAQTDTLADAVADTLYNDAQTAADSQALAATLTAQADGVLTEQAPELLLAAAAETIRRGEFDAAQIFIERVAYQPMTVAERNRLALHQAHLTQALGRHERALELLNEAAQSPTLDARAAARLLLLRATSQDALGQSDAALASLLQRDSVLEPAGRVANQRLILNHIASLNPIARLLLRENPADDAIHGWLALGEVLQFEAPAVRAAAIRQWRAHYPEHPAAQRLFNAHLPADQANRYRNIALLLPLTSKFGGAAEAFYEGFMAAHKDDPARPPPTVRLYDIGGDPLLVTLYYRAAINDGADFLVGPLGRRAVNELLGNVEPQLPVLMVGAVPEDKIAADLYGISLSPEQEARQVAARAFADGHRQAGIFRSDSLWGRRVADAFAAQWEAFGGTVVEDSAFSADIADYPRIIQKLLGVDESIKRERILSARLGINLQFTPRRRDDLDFLFLAANAEQARLLVPQLRFFHAHDLALYATSYVYSGKPEPAVDADLDGIIFGDMNWILDAAVLPEPEPVAVLETEPAAVVEAELGGEAEVESESEVAAEVETQADDESLVASQSAQDDQPPAETATEAAESEQTEQTPAPTRPLPGREPGPYYHTDLDRLYALGLESYQVIPGLQSLRRNPWQRYFGAAVDLGVEADGNIFRHLAWAKFEHGVPVPLPETAATIPSAQPILPAPPTPVTPLPVPLPLPGQ